MGYDLYARTPRVACPTRLGFGAPDAWYFRFVVSEMDDLVVLLSEADVLDLDAEPSDPPEPPPRAWEHFDHEGQPLSDEARQFVEAEEAARASAGLPGRVPLFKFRSNDGWIVMPDECRSIASALEARLIPLAPELRPALISEFIAFNRRCGELADGYEVW